MYVAFCSYQCSETVSVCGMHLVQGCALLVATAACAACRCAICVPTGGDSGLQMYADGVVASIAVLQQRAEDAEAANATLVKQAQDAHELCSSVQRRLHESEQVNKSLRCQLNEQEQVVQVRHQLSLQIEL